MAFHATSSNIDRVDSPAVYVLHTMQGTVKLCLLECAVLDMFHLFNPHGLYCDISANVQPDHAGMSGFE